MKRLVDTMQPDPKMADSLATLYFRAGLSPLYRQQLKPEYNSFQDMMQDAKRLEDAFGNPVVTTLSNPTSANNDATKLFPAQWRTLADAEQALKIKAEEFELKSKADALTAQFKNLTTSSPARDRQCNMMENTADQDPEQPAASAAAAQATQPAPVCFRCQETGHIARNCTVYPLPGRPGYSPSFYPAAPGGWNAPSEYFLEPSNAANFQPTDYRPQFPTPYRNQHPNRWYSPLRIFHTNSNRGQNPNQGRNNQPYHQAMSYLHG